MPDNHVILTCGRSGSNYLVNLINQHPRLVNLGEVLGAWTWPRKLHCRFGAGGPTVECLFNSMLRSRYFFAAGQAYRLIHGARQGRLRLPKRYGRILSIGVKEFVVNVEGYELEPYLQSRRDIRVIVLVREDPLRRLVSNRFLARTGVAVLRKPHAAEKPMIYLDPSTLLAELRQISSENLRLGALAGRLDGHRVIWLQYERMFNGESSHSWSDELFGFLGVEPIEHRTEHRKILPVALERTVSNYDAVHEVLQGTEFEEWAS